MFLVLILFTDLKLTEDLVLCFGMRKEVVVALGCFLKPAFYAVLLIVEKRHFAKERGGCGKFPYFIV